MATRRALGLGLALAAIGLASIAFLLLRPFDARAEGPLQPPANQIDVDLNLPQGAVGTWGAFLPVDTAGRDIVLIAVAPRTSSGLDIVGVVGCDLVATSGCVGTALGFPPPGIPTQPIAGIRLGARPTGSGQFMALFGVRLPSGSVSGEIDGYRVTYAADGVTYLLDIGDSFHLVAAPADVERSNGAGRLDSMSR